MFKQPVIIGYSGFGAVVLQIAPTAGCPSLLTLIVIETSERRFLIAVALFGLGASDELALHRPP